MEMKVNGVTKEFNFEKIRFINKLDKVYKAEKEGMNFGFGLMFANIYLEQYSVPALVTILKCACTTVVNEADMEAAVEEYAEEKGDLEPLFKQVIEELGKSKVAKATVKRLKSLENQKR